MMYRTSRAAVWTACAAVVAAAVVLLLVTGCTPREETSGPPPPPKAVAPPGDVGETAELAGEIMVLVPCGQQGPFSEAKQVFMDKYPDVTVSEEVGNIDVLRSKVLDDKLPDADVFLDMGDSAAKELEEAGKTVGALVGYASNSIAVIVPKENKAGIESFEDLAKDSVTAIGIATPEGNSNGVYAREALKAAGLWDELESGGKVVDVPQPAQLKAMINRGKADAAIIYAACGAEAADPSDPAPKAGLPENVKYACLVPPDLYTPFMCTGAVLAGTDNEAAAKAFLDFLTTDEAKEMWAKWNFVTAEELEGRLAGEGEEGTA